jgi:DNA replication and repair protein RecF
MRQDKETERVFDSDKNESASAPRITRLRLTGFRSYAKLDVAFPASLVAFAGQNGAGKTNILEALSLLTPGRGLRRAQLAAMVHRGGAGGFAVLADGTGEAGDVLLATALEAGESQRQCRIDREPVSSANRFLDHLAMLWLTPDQDGLFRGSAGDRRRFLDRLVLAVDGAHGSRASAFETALRHRNRLLEDPGTDPRWLDAIEQEVAELGTAMAAARLETVTRLGALMGAEAGLIAPFPHAELHLAGEIEARLLTEAAGTVEDVYRAALRDNRNRDRAAGRALIGPQASDLLVTHGPKGEAAATCSTGEQKALLIGLVLAQAQLIAQMRGSPPILLLDEIAAHLDEARRAALYAILDKLGGQVFMTGTDASLFTALPPSGTCLRVEDGKVG